MSDYRNSNRDREQETGGSPWRPAYQGNHQRQKICRKASRIQAAGRMAAGRSGSVHTHRVRLPAQLGRERPHSAADWLQRHGKRGYYSHRNARSKRRHIRPQLRPTRRPAARPRLRPYPPPSRRPRLTKGRWYGILRTAPVSTLTRMPGMKNATQETIVAAYNSGKKPCDRCVTSETAIARQPRDYR